MVKPPTLEWTLSPWFSYWRMDGDWTNQPTQHARMKCKLAASDLFYENACTVKSKGKRGTHYTPKISLLHKVNITVMHEVISSMKPLHTILSSHILISLLPGLSPAQCAASGWAGSMFANNALLGGGVSVRVWIREQRKIKRRSKALLSL